MGSHTPPLPVVPPSARHRCDRLIQPDQVSRTLTVLSGADPGEDSQVPCFTLVDQSGEDAACEGGREPDCQGVGPGVSPREQARDSVTSATNRQDVSQLVS